MTTTSTTHTSETTSVLARLRRIAPTRGLSGPEALRVAELQADALLRATDVMIEPVPLDIFARLPRTRVRAEAGLASSGISFWDGENWRLIANADEHPNRQRFSLAHEYKHIIDHPVRDLLYPNHRLREAAADQFAACVLMPRRLVTRAWCAGEQDIAQLADRFAVSAAAMARRLTDLGHLEHRPPRRSICTRGLPTTPRFAMSGHRTPTGVPL